MDVYLIRITLLTGADTFNINQPTRNAEKDLLLTSILYVNKQRYVIAKRFGEQNNSLNSLDNENNELSFIHARFSRF